MLLNSFNSEELKSRQDDLEDESRLLGLLVRIKVSSILKPDVGILPRDIISLRQVTGNNKNYWPFQNWFIPKRFQKKSKKSEESENEEKEIGFEECDDNQQVLDLELESGQLMMCSQPQQSQSRPIQQQPTKERPTISASEQLPNNSQKISFESKKNNSGQQKNYCDNQRNCPDHQIKCSEYPKNCPGYKKNHSSSTYYDDNKCQNIDASRIHHQNVQKSRDQCQEKNRYDQDEGNQYDNHRSYHRSRLEQYQLNNRHNRHRERACYSNDCNRYNQSNHQTRYDKSYSQEEESHNRYDDRRVKQAFSEPEILHQCHEDDDYEYRRNDAPLIDPKNRGYVRMAVLGKKILLTM